MGAREIVGVELAQLQVGLGRIACGCLRLRAYPDKDFMSLLEHKVFRKLSIPYILIPAIFDQLLIWRDR